MTAQQAMKWGLSIVEPSITYHVSHTTSPQGLEGRDDVTLSSDLSPDLSVCVPSWFQSCMTRLGLTNLSTQVRTGVNPFLPTFPHSHL